jgi:hypothetical protein
LLKAGEKMTKIFELKDELKQINDLIKRNAKDSKQFEKILVSLMEQQNKLMEHMINKLEELEAVEEVFEEQEEK